MTTNMLDIIKEALPALGSVFTGIISIASVVIGFFLKRLVKQLDGLAQGFEELKLFTAVQKEKNVEVEEIKDDLRDTQKIVNHHEVRIGQLEQTNKILNKSGAN